MDLGHRRYDAIALHGQQGVERRRNDLHARKAQLLEERVLFIASEELLTGVSERMMLSVVVL